jgi:hypothetical protein
VTHTLLSIDPGAKPGFAVFVDGALAQLTDDADTIGLAHFDQLVVEDQYAATHIYRNGRRVRVSRKSQQGLSFTAGRLFERFSAARKYRIPVSEWRGVLWPRASRLTKPVVLARLRLAMPEGVLTPDTTDDMIEAWGIGKAFLAMGEDARKKLLRK